VHGKAIKVRPPEPFDGTRSKLRYFLTKLDAYIHVNRTKFTNDASKVLYASTCLSGAAYKWFEPFLKEYLEQEANPKEDEARDDTQAIFRDYSVFKK
jgi:hypothetical protein